MNQLVLLSVLFAVGYFLLSTAIQYHDKIHLTKYWIMRFIPVVSKCILHLRLRNLPPLLLAAPPVCIHCSLGYSEPGVGCCKPAVQAVKKWHMAIGICFLADASSVLIYSISPYDNVICTIHSRNKLLYTFSYYASGFNHGVMHVRFICLTNSSYF